MVLMGIAITIPSLTHTLAFLYQSRRISIT